LYLLSIPAPLPIYIHVDILSNMHLRSTVRRIGTRYLASKATAYAVGAIVGGGVPGLLVGWAAQRYVVPRVVAVAEGAIEQWQTVSITAACRPGMHSQARNVTGPDIWRATQTIGGS